MIRSTCGRFVLLAVVLGSTVLPAGRALAGDEPPEKPPGPGSTGKLYSAKAENGLAYHYFLPKSYDPAKGITMTLILHGSNGSRWWGFNMHAAGEFRPDDFVVSPDGTTSNGQGGFNSLQRSEDLQRFHEFVLEMKKLVKVNATFIYGLSQGSFFAHYYAGQHGDEVDGIVAHGSGLWIGSGLAKKNHHQAIAVMHGRGDPVYPYGGGVAAYQGYVELKYPTLKFRTLEIDLHWAPWGHQAQQLAWCEAMTTSDPERLLASFDWMEQVKDSDGWFLDPVAAYQIARRVTGMDGVDDSVKAKAKKRMEEIEAIAGKHVAGIEGSFKSTRGKLLPSATWIAHARFFLRDWQGVPAADAFAKEWQKTIKAHADAAKDAWTDYYAELKQGDNAKAMAAAIRGIEKGGLHYWCADPEMLANLAAWRKDPQGAKIPPALLKQYDRAVVPFLEATKQGKQDSADLNRKL
jgi:predicted esterase